MKYVVYLICIFFILASCKKDRLKDEKSILIGTWNWDFSEREYGWCDGMTFTEMINHESYDEQFSLEFSKKGKAYFYSNGDLLNEYRIVFENYLIDDGFVFKIYLDNKEELRLMGKANDSILYCYDYPFQTIEGSCEEFKNYFVRE